MAGMAFPGRHALKLNRIALMWLFPKLREVPPEAWKVLLNKARLDELQTAEWIAVTVGVAFVAWLLGLETFGLSEQSPFIVHILRFVLALPLLAAIVGPIYLRCTRRGLDRELTRGGWNLHKKSKAPLKMKGGMK